MAILIMMLLPVPIMAWGFIQLANRVGVRRLYCTCALMVLAATFIILFCEKNGFSRFWLLETALLGLFLLLGGAVLIASALKRNQHWHLLLLATSVVGFSVAVSCIEIYRIVL